MQAVCWKTKSFDELTGSEIYEILKERCAVFIVEQTCPYQDPDGMDRISTHIFAEQDGEIHAYCRITPKGSRFPEISVGRVITSTKARGTGLGRELMSRAMRYIAEETGERVVRISGQCYLRRFYESFGFRACSEEYMEDGLPHFEMLYHAEEAQCARGKEKQP